MINPHTLVSLATGSLALATSFSTAATWTSNATGGANWSLADNWTGDVAPVNGADIVIGIPVTGGTRITTNDTLTSINSLWLQANLNEANGNAVSLSGNSVQYTAGGSSIGKIGLAMTLTRDTTYTIGANTSGRLEVSGGIAGDFDLIKDGAGRLRLVGTAKAYTGDTMVTNGILDTSATDMLAFGSGKGNVHVGTGAEFFLNNVSTQINGLNDYNGTSGTVNKGGSNTRSLTLGNGDANGSFGGSMTFGGGSSTINKVGAGTQTLGGNVTTAGLGTVFGGKLLINGSWSNSMAVNSGGTLGGTGTVGGTVTVNANGTLATGTSAGSLEIAGNLVLAGSSTTLIELGGAAFTLNGTEEYDRAKLTGAASALTLGGGNLGVSLINSFTLAANQAFGIIQLESGASRTGTFNGLATDGALVGNYGGMNLYITYSGNFGDSGTVGLVGGNDIVLYTVPEPAAPVLGALGMILLLRRRRL